MTPAEKVAYLKGLIEGMDVDGETKEGKLFTVIADILEDLALDLEDTQETVDDLGEEVDDLADELDELEDCLFDDDDDDDDDCCCGHHHHHGGDDCCCEDDDEDEEPVFYEVTCPACENTITVDEDVLLMGSIQCPNCGETLEFDIEEIEDEDSSEDEE